MLESSGQCKNITRYTLLTFLKVRKDSVKFEGMHDIVPCCKKLYQIE